MYSSFTRITYILIFPLPVQSSFSELSEVLSPMLQSSFYPKENNSNSHIVPFFQVIHLCSFLDTPVHTHFLGQPHLQKSLCISYSSKFSQQLTAQLSLQTVFSLDSVKTLYLTYTRGDKVQNLYVVLWAELCPCKMHVLKF